MVNTRTSNNLQNYIFYFFSYFKPKKEFNWVKINQKSWGRYDILQKEQYGDVDYFWVIQLFDSKDDFWHMKYDYDLLIPDRKDIDEYIGYLHKYIIYNR